MHLYKFAAYEVKLLKELQRQQNSAQFCDALLQTEGISVPVHSCVLAALSPYMFQQLSATPSPPLGQKRQLRLQGLSSHTLLKLVALLYTGEVQLNEWDRNDVTAAARRFGMMPLIPKMENRGQCCVSTDAATERASWRKTQNAQKQARIKDTGSSVEIKLCECREPQTKAPTPKHIALRSQNIPPYFGEASLPQPSVSLANPKSNPQASQTPTLGVSNIDGATGAGRSTHVSTRMSASDGECDEMSASGVQKMSEDENGNSARRRRATANIANKNMDKMKQMDASQISVKESSNHKQTQKDLLNIQPTPSMTHPPPDQTHHAHNTQSESSKSTESPVRSNNTPNPSCNPPSQQHDNIESAYRLRQTHGSGEISEEQVWRMLDDMSWNVLPDLAVPEDGTGPTKMISCVTASECPYSQNFCVQSGQPSTHTAQDLLNCKSVPRVDPGNLMIQQQLLAQMLSTVRIPSDPYPSVSRSQSSLFSYTTVDPALVSGISHTTQNRYNPPLQEKPAQLLSTQVSNPNDEQSLPCLDYLRLPRCLSPLEPITSLAVDKPVDNIKQQLSQCRNPWLPEQSALLCFPLSDVEDKKPPSWNLSQTDWPMQILDHKQSRPCTTNRVRQTAAERKSYPHRMKRTLVQEQSVTKESPVASKTRKECADDPPVAARSVTEGIKSQKCMSVCSVSLSMNNILAKERNRSSGPSKALLEARTKCSQISNASQTGITNKGVRKTTGKPLSCKRTKKAKDPKPAECPPPVASKQAPLIKPNRGRSAKIKPASQLISKCENKKKELAKMELDKSKTKRKCQQENRKGVKRKVLLEKIGSAEKTSVEAADYNPKPEMDQQGNNQGSSPTDNEAHRKNTMPSESDFTVQNFAVHMRSADCAREEDIEVDVTSSPEKAIPIWPCEYTIRPDPPDISEEEEADINVTVD
ncbi:uncharacterized protein [Nerophis lumbriciformis]|uniref:uncharacterized protein isoform X2 n=1 Tax=Nerophis lumbriciformis TaxID=546530 RepID=UPI002ADF1F1E|nr:uncharacterized protein LOC133617224 isoform X2 [Nerophis lumbriciformis]